MMPHPKLPVPRPYHRHPFQPKPRQLPPRKRMTIAIGVLAKNGVVIAADTQESFGFGYPKSHGYKIFSRVVEGDDRAISLSGSGDAGYLDALMQELADDFIRTPDPAKAERQLKAKCLEFYRDHGFIHAPRAPETVPPGPRVIAGLHWKNRKTLLMANHGSAMYTRKRAIAVGIGEPQASSILSRILPSHSHDTDINLAALIAAFVICRVKNSTEGCGLGTHVTVLTDGHGKHFSSGTMALLEQYFDYHQLVENQIFAYIIGRSLKNEAQAPKELIDWIGKMRASFRGLFTITPEQKAATVGLRFDDESDVPVEVGGYIKLYGDAIVPREAWRRDRSRSKRAPRARQPSQE